jgi:hypothetical protein
MVLVWLQLQLHVPNLLGYFASSVAIAHIYIYIYNSYYGVQLILFLCVLTSQQAISCRRNGIFQEGLAIFIFLDVIT